MARLRNLRPGLAIADVTIARVPPKRADQFYLSLPWRRLMTALIAKRGRRCEECGRTRDDAGQAVRIFGDHVVELQDGGAPLDEGNVRLLCGACHTRKTLAARAARHARPT